MRERRKRDALGRGKGSAVQGQSPPIRVVIYNRFATPEAIRSVIYIVWGCREAIRIVIYMSLMSHEAIRVVIHTSV